MNQRASLGARLRYEFDKSMAAGPIALIGWLTVVTLAITAFAALVLIVTRISPEGGQPLGFAEALWETSMRAMDAGTVGGDMGWPFRLIMLAVTIAGILVFSALVGVLSAAIDGKLAELRKGHSKVLEHGHTIIFNWSSSIFDVITELAIANESERRARIVIMANRDKVEMEDEIAAKVGALKSTRIIVRSGDPTDLYDLGIASPQTSKSMIVLSPEGDDADSQVIKTVLALVNDPERRAAPYRIAAELREPKNLDVARVVGGEEVQLVLADDLISRIVVHSSRQLGLSAVYSELLDFDGCEIYTCEQPDLVGKTFGEAVLSYDTSALIGLCDAGGKVSLNPPMDTVIPEGARVIIIAEDDSAIPGSKAANPVVDTGAIVPPRPSGRKPDRTLLLGWNRRAPVVALELSRYVAPGSVLTICADAPGFEAEVEALDVLNGLEVQHRVMDTSSAANLEAVDVGSYDHVMVLGYADTLSPQAADTRTLVTLLQIRRIADAAGKHISVVSEMADVRNQALAAVTRADDFVVSNRLVSLMLAQASENPYLAAIFEDLLDEEGSEICMRPVEDYVQVGSPQTFFTIAEAARQRGEVAFGYSRRRQGETYERNMGGVVVNPAKSQAVQYAPGDRIIVLARD